MSYMAKFLSRVQDKLAGMTPSAFHQEELLDFQWEAATSLIAGDY